MADNVAITAGSGTSIATDDIGGVQYQRIKIGLGADGSATDAVGGAGAVSDAVQRITLASDDPAVALLTTMDADTGAMVTDLAAIEVLLTTIDGRVDGIEALIGTTNSTLTTIDGRVDTLETLIATTNTNTGNAATALQILDDWDNAASDGASVSGDVAHDAVDAGEPVKIGARAIASLSAATPVAAADRTNVFADLDGALVVRMDGCLGDDVSGNASNTDGTNTQCIAAAGAGIKTYLTDFTITNTSASNIFVELKDGSTTRWTVPVPANGGVTHSFRTPVAGTANTAWNFDPSAATTTVYCSMSGFRSKL